ncbi:hypothetical protein OJAV_G00081910 [Oryzias javanicus]|uniref:Uncharacterized protein n=1 Tax=Oryzias javanicus TaxID=123683 RepID=A0A3S2MM24_ORYJA|nr:hypothetical protein OJAV_G00081910 [Oryzias javanicus]
MNRGGGFLSEGGENVYNTRLCFGGDQGRRVLASLPLASPSLYAASVRACVLVCALQPAPLLFAAATDEPGRGGKAAGSGQRKTGGVWFRRAGPACACDLQRLFLARAHVRRQTPAHSCRLDVRLNERGESAPWMRR